VIKIDHKNKDNYYLEKGEELLGLLMAALCNLRGLDARPEETSHYRSYLHGQIYGMAAALRIIYPGPGNLGERAALALRPVVTEHHCQCSAEETGKKDISG
jgi:LAO/AO transport system kinase